MWGKSPSQLQHAATWHPRGACMRVDCCQHAMQGLWVWKCQRGHALARPTESGETGSLRQARRLRCWLPRAGPSSPMIHSWCAASSLPACVLGTLFAVCVVWNFPWLFNNAHSVLRQKALQICMHMLPYNRPRCNRAAAAPEDETCQQLKCRHIRRAFAENL